MVQTANDITVSKEKMQNRSHRTAWESNKKAWNIEKKVLYMGESAICYKEQWEKIISSIVECAKYISLWNRIPLHAFVNQLPHV